MKELKSYLHNHPKITKGIVMGYLIFAGCFVFPFGNELFPLDFTKGYLVVATYGIIGLGFAGVYGEHKEKFVYIISLVLTGIGMICRYFLEYGEVSNTRNFTKFNIISFLVIILFYTLVAYHLKHLIEKN